MLKKIINECRLTLTLETKGPFIIKDGRYKKREEREPDSIPIFLGDITEIGNNLDSIKNTVSSKCFIPGTSLRGVIRSHTEKIVRSIIEDENKPLCCDPFDNEKTSNKFSCSKRMDPPPKLPYSKACVICKLFGCTATTSRIQIHDGKTKKLGRAVLRDNIGIDRFTGAVAQQVTDGKPHGANFRTLVLEGYTFTNEILIRNFELWQLGLLAYVFRDLEKELIPLGSGKSKGFGRVKGTVNTVELTYYKDNQNQLKGISELCDKGEVETYNLISIPIEPAINLVPLSVSEWDSYRRRFSFETNPNNDIAKSPFWGACAKVWNQAVKEGKFKTIPELKGDGGKWLKLDI